jgi:hypothetical protein
VWRLACAGLMWALLFIRSSAGAHRHSRMGTGGYSYWWWDDWGLGWGGVDGAGAASASTRSLALVVFGVAAIGVIKCYYDAYRCALPASRPRPKPSDIGGVLAIERPSALTAAGL